MIGAKQLEGVGEVDHLGDGRRLFERVIAKGERDASHLTVKLCVGVWRAACDDLRFTLWRRVLDAYIEAAPSDRISETSLFVAGQNDKWNARGFDCSEFGDGELPGGEDLQQHCFETIVYFVEFVDQEHAWPFALESAHQWSGPKEITSLQVPLNRLPAFVLALVKLHVEPLQSLVELPDRLLLGDTSIALQPLHMRV